MPLSASSRFGSSPQSATGGTNQVAPFNPNLGSGFLVAGAQIGPQGAGLNVQLGAVGVLVASLIFVAYVVWVR
jgi:hypothetical protein